MPRRAATTMRPGERVTPKRFWERVETISRLADLQGARFEDDTPDKRILRKARAVVLPEAFNRTYLPHYFRDEGCGMHQVFYLALESGRFLAVRAPRGHAKTTTGTFAYGLHQVVCGPVLRAWEDGTLAEEDPDLHAVIGDAIATEVRRRIAAGPLTCEQLAIPEHWADGITEKLDAWLHDQWERVCRDKTIPLHWDPYIQIVADTVDTAEEFTGAIRVELERNERIASDWGDLSPTHHNDWGKKQPRAASEGDFASAGVRVRAFGMNGSLRGGKHGEWRPTLLLGDDLDSEESTRTYKQREKNLKKLLAAAGRGLDERKKRIFVVGTPVQSDCVVCRLTEQPRFAQRWTQCLRFRARDDDGTILYPAKWTHEALDDELEDPESYGSELDDRPPAEGERPFKELHHYDCADYAGMPLGKVMILDPSLGRTKESDFQALILLRGPTPDGKILVHRAELLRIADPLALVGHVNGVYGEEQPDRAAVEAISLGSLVESLLTSLGNAASLFPGYERIERHDRSKDLRIRGLAPLVNGATLLFPSDGSCRQLERQFLDYPDGKKDGPDGVEMGVRLLRQPSLAASLKQVRHTERRSAGFRREF